MEDYQKYELEIEVEKGVADKAARLEFYEATRRVWEEYEKIWRPVRERWEEFSKPHFKILQTKLVANRKAYDEAIEEIRFNWQVCPKCGLSAARYQVFCTNDKCGTNLIVSRPKEVK